VNRLASNNIALEWNARGITQKHVLTARQNVNLRRIVQEIISNIMKHASPSKVQSSIYIDDNQLKFEICSDGEVKPFSQWLPGKGLTNIKTRAMELKGDVTWQTNIQSDKQLISCFKLSFPLNLEY
jgi:signal transduction histidine kinase